jgi:hypothetical protein
VKAIYGWLRILHDRFAPQENDEGSKRRNAARLKPMWYLAEMMALDVSIAMALVALTIIMAYLGMTLHPHDSPRAQFWYRFSFSFYGLCAVSLLIWQGIRNRDAARQIITLQGDVAEAKDEARSALQEVVNERARRRQVERDLAIVQESGSMLIVNVASLKPIVVQKIERR